MGQQSGLGRGDASAIRIREGRWVSNQDYGGEMGQQSGLREGRWVIN